MMELVILVIRVILAIAAIYLQMANIRAYRERVAFLDSIHYSVMAADEYDFVKIDSMWESYKSVSYYKHLWYIMTFRDPMKLYK
jgi:hypothetical protein